jgi:hypothetical protein
MGDSIISDPLKQALLVEKQWIGVSVLRAGLLPLMLEAMAK